MEETAGQHEAWLAAASADQAVGERRRAAWLARQAADELTWSQLMGELAARASVVVLETTGGRSHRGTLERSGEDFCTLRCKTGERVLVARSGTAAVRAQGLGVGPPGVQAPSLGFAEAVRSLCGDGSRVVVRCGGSTAEWRGELHLAGPDRLDLRLENGEVAHIPLGSVVEVVAPA